MSKLREGKQNTKYNFRAKKICLSNQRSEEKHGEGMNQTIKQINQLGYHKIDWHKSNKIKLKTKKPRLKLDKRRIVKTISRLYSETFLKQIV